MSSMTSLSFPAISSGVPIYAPQNVEVLVGKSPETVSASSMTTTLSTLLEKPSSIRRRVVISRASPLRLSVVLAARAWAAVIPETTL
jgi:hypothetical protein